MSEYYANKEKRDELSDLSEKVFGTRSKWKWFVNTRGYTIELIEQSMNTLYSAIEQQLEDGSAKKKVSSNSPTRVQRRKYLRALAKIQRRSQVTTGGSE